MLNVSQGFFPDTKLAKCECDDSVPSSAKVKKSDAVPTLPHFCLQGMHRDNFISLNFNFMPLRGKVKFTPGQATKA